MKKKNTEKFKIRAPLLVWDRDCDFCQLCIERFHVHSGNRVDLVPYQDLLKRYPEAPELDYKRSLVFFSKENKAYKGAAAVYRLYLELGRGWGFKLYFKFRWFAVLSEWFYRLVAEHRGIFLMIVKTLWGSNLLPDTYRMSGWVFGRSLGLITLLAFLSFWSQADGLIGPDGIIPFQDDLEHVERIIGTQSGDISKWSLRPTLLWFFGNGTGMHQLFFLGTMASLLLMVGIMPHLSIVLSWVCYISLASVAEPFLNFQWDALLLETLFLSLFVVPWSLRDQIDNAKEPLIFGRWLIWLLLFKLMFESGIVKFTYFASDGSNTWWNLTALEYHYWTQPIPSWISWYFHQLPSWFDKISLVITYLCELVLPIFIFFPRRFRRLSCIGLIIFQLCIILTGNYGFFNVLTIILCITLVDDLWFPRWLKERAGSKGSSINEYIIINRLKKISAIMVIICFLWVTVVYLDRDRQGNVQPLAEHSEPSIITSGLVKTAQLTRSMNAYGLFRVMTITRPEIIIEAMFDNNEWEQILFKYKPVEITRAPRLFFIHMPRLDWQCWFEALFIERLLTNSFALSVYNRFLSVMVRTDMNIGKIQLDDFILDRDREVLRTLEQADQQRYIQNLQIHINNYMNRSYWFARFLSLLARTEKPVYDLLNSKGKDQPSKLRVSLYRYSFTEIDAKRESGKWWERNQVKDFSLVIDLE